MSLRSRLVALFLTGLAVAGFSFWISQRNNSPDTAPLANTIPVVAGDSGATPAFSAQEAASPPGTANSVAREIYDKGNARAAENAKIREDLAAGKPVPLPDSLKVADLPPQPLPPGPVQPVTK